MKCCKTQVIAPHARFPRRFMYSHEGLCLRLSLRLEREKQTFKFKALCSVYPPAEANSLILMTFYISLDGIYFEGWNIDLLLWSNSLA